MGEWINKLWNIQAMEPYSAIKRSKLPIPETTWINFKGIMLRKKILVLEDYILCNSNCMIF